MKKLLRLILAVCIVTGYFLILGTAGSSDLNLIDGNTALAESGKGIALVLGGAVGLKYTN